MPSFLLFMLMVVSSNLLTTCFLLEEGHTWRRHSHVGSVVQSSLKFVLAESLLSCARSCSISQNSCVSFSYDRTTTECFLEPQLVTGPSSQVHFTEVSHFTASVEPTTEMTTQEVTTAETSNCAGRAQYTMMPGGLSCIRPVQSMSDWDSARDFCIGEGGLLVCADTAAIRNDLLGVLTNLGVNGYEWWMGRDSCVHGDWQLSTSTRSCNNKYYFICEIYD